MNTHALLIAGLTATAFLFTDVASIPVAGFGIPAAYANGGNGDGHGRGASRGGSKDEATSPQIFAAGGQKNAETEAAEDAAEAKSLDAKLGAFHAANANLQAFIDASPTSRVGLIAGYARALAALQGASAAVVAAEQTLSAAKTTLTDATTLRDAALSQLRAGYSDVDPAALQDARNALANDLLNCDDPSDIDQTNAKIAAIDKALAAAATLATAACALDDAIATLAEAQSNAEAASRAANDALAEAANQTPVDAEAKAYLDDELGRSGILDYYRSLTTPSSSTE